MKRPRPYSARFEVIGPAGPLWAVDFPVAPGWVPNLPTLDVDDSEVGWARSILAAAYNGANLYATFARTGDPMPTCEEMERMKEAGARIIEGDAP